MLAVLIPDGVGVRNFVLGPVIAQASRRMPVVALHDIPDDLLPTYRAAVDGEVEWRPLGRHHDTSLSLVLRNSLAYAQMYWVDTLAMRYSRRRSTRGSWQRRAAAQAARIVGRAAASARGIQLLDQAHVAVVGRMPAVDDYRRRFERERPSVLFCTHQRPPSILPPVLAAKSLGIPTATFIFSWDNLSSKGRIAAPFDHFLVWSPLMRRELLRYYPDVSADRVHIVGTPQFDPYAHESLRCSRGDFFRTVGADPARPLICYSGGDATTCPEDPAHLSILLDLVRAGRIRGNPQVLLRSAPVDSGRRYDEVRRRYPELLYAAPAWVHSADGEWSSVLPLAEDIRFLANLMRHADLNVNVASTMTLDFAIHDKPVVNIAFDVVTPHPRGATMWDSYYQYEHYRPVVELGAARFARSPEELASHVNSYLTDPSLDRNGRRRLVDLQVGVAVGRSSARIIEVIEGIAACAR